MGLSVLLGKYLPGHRTFVEQFIPVVSFLPFARGSCKVESKDIWSAGIGRHKSPTEKALTPRNYFVGKYFI